MTAQSFKFCDLAGHAGSHHLAGGVAA
jgi:hypothetical protein